MAKKRKTSFKKKKKDDKPKTNSNREEYSAEFNAVIHNNVQQPKQR